jgi:hypothetical protein
MMYDLEVMPECKPWKYTSRLKVGNPEIDTTTEIKAKELRRNMPRLCFYNWHYFFLDVTYKQQQ